MASMRSATFFAAISSASSLLTSLAAAELAAALLAAVEEDAPQPVSTPAHRASAAAAAVTRCQFLLVALRIVLSPFCLGGIGISDRKGTKRGPAQTKKGLSAARKAQQKDPLNDSGFLVRPIPRDPELGAPVPTAGRFPD